MVIDTSKSINSEEELDRLELEAALSAACHTADSAEISMSYTAPGVLEVSYNEGGTELFSYLEQCEWQKAFELCTKESLMTWVKSTGTTNTVSVCLCRITMIFNKAACLLTLITNSLLLLLNEIHRRLDGRYGGVFLFMR